MPRKAEFALTFVLMTALGLLLLSPAPSPATPQTPDHNITQSQSHASPLKCEKPSASTFLRLEEDSCSDWMQQDNGCYWRTCVDSQGHQYCEECCQGNCNRVECK